MPGVDAIKATLDELIEALSARSIICAPIEMEDKVIIPITKMGMGFGTDIDQRCQDASKEGLGRCKAGGGVGLFPVAVVVIFKGISGPDGVLVVPLSPPEDSVTSIAHVVMERIMGHEECQGKRTENMAAVKVE
ncbi:MAG: hypothetical protein LUO89_00265 [Methanothrix sp.]|nr:hypothetical protein [Methanothrix sp.]